MNKNRFIKTIVCTLLMSLCSPVLFCQTTNDSAANDSVIRAKLRLANKLLYADGQQQAYSLYQQCAATGSAQAMNAIGILLQRGWGVEKDMEQSVAWFQRAADAGYGRAYYNLAQIYAKALGVPQDFEQAVYYYTQLLPYEPRTANFRLGYHYYKGLGVEQNYETAVDYFLAAAELQSANAFYFLGLCYRNGYGVPYSEGEAQFYLQKAAEMGHYYSEQELAEETAETQPTETLPAFARGINGNAPQPQMPTFRKLERQNLKGDFAGEYAGMITTFDFSGRKIAREVPLKIRITTPDLQGKVTGEWTEADSITATFEAILTDSSLQFVNTSYARTDHYNRKRAAVWNFTKAILEKTELDGETFLAGNIQMYSPRDKEPEKPMYISLKQTANGRGVARNAPVERAIFTATPLPNSNDIQVSFSLDKNETATLAIYNLAGQQIYSTNLGQIQQGRHDYTIEFNAPAGLYLVGLRTESIKHSTLITKK